MIVVVLVSLVILLLLSEIVLRVNGTFATYSEKNYGDYASYFDPYSSQPINKRSQTEDWMEAAEYKFPMGLNSNGFRDSEWLILDTSTVKILILGDSFTEGVGAPPDSSWPSIFESIINDEHVGGKSYQVWNAGVSGYDPFYSYYLFKEELLKLKPNVVIFHTHSGDFDDYFARGGLERFKEDGTVSWRKPDWPEGLYQYCHLFRLYTHAFTFRDQLFQTQADRNHLIDKAIVEQTDLMLEMQAVGLQNNFNFEVLISPLSFEAERGEYADYMVRFIESLVKNKIPVISTIDGLHQHILDGGVKQDIYWKMDNHNTPLGYYILAKSLKDSLITVQMLN